MIVAGATQAFGERWQNVKIGEFAKIAYRRRARIASVCNGTLPLAASGISDGRRAATHWKSVERLRRLRPQVDVDDEAIYIRDGNVWTSAGVTAGII